MKIKNMPVLVPIPISSDPTSWWKAVVDWRLNKRRFILMEDWEFTIPAGHGREKDIKIKLPKGFIFDGASVPRFLWPILNPFGILLLAGICHDFGYRYDFIVDDHYRLIFVNVGRKFWDEVFYDVARATNGIYVFNKAAYAMLRVFGIFSWRKNRNNNVPVYWILDDRDIIAVWNDLTESLNPDIYLSTGYPRDAYIKNYASIS